MNDLLDDNLALLDQAARMLDAVDDDAYARAEPGLGLSALGSHLRHCLDMLSCLLAGLESGAVDYDRRERDERLERDRQHARECVLRLQRGLRGLDAAALDRTLRVKSDTGALDGTWTASTLGRELVFLASHSVHHFALMAVLLRAGGQAPEEGFGVAPSTLKHLRLMERDGRCAR